MAQEQRSFQGSQSARAIGDPAAHQAADQEWKEHEHVAPAVQVEAEKLVERAGSAELAKQAIDEVSQQEKRLAAQREELARQHGFPSLDAMLASSIRLSAPDGSAWWATEIQHEGWMIWSDRELAVKRRFPTLEACHRFLASERGAPDVGPSPVRG
ncbi:MAG: hypothetical protein AB7O38_18720 [Pirellulaceae bacterium]